jgi:predicted SAM-dependent methyltransferase
MRLKQIGKRVLGSGGIAAVKRLQQAPRKASIRRQRRRHPVDPAARKLNIGGGPWYQPGWEVVDLYIDDFFVDHRCDLRDEPTLPLPDGSAVLVFSSHTIEHMDDHAAQHLIAETHRLLRPGGVLRLSTPDGAAARAAYLRQDDAFFSEGGVKCTGPTLEHKLVNYFASYRLDGHSGGPDVDPAEVRAKVDLPIPAFAAWCASLIPAEAEYVAHVNGYDEEKLCGMLREAGFEQPYRSSFMASTVPELRGPAFDNRPLVSLFVEAVR